MTNYVHPNALVDGGAILGTGTRVWAFAHILGGAVIGNDCNICDHTFVEGGVKVGDRVTVKCGVFLWTGLVVEDDVFIGPSATFTNDIRPRSRRYLTSYPRTLLRKGCTVGANAVVLPGVTIGQWAMVGAGAVVTRDVADFSLVLGVPARFNHWVCECGERLPDPVNHVTRCECGNRFVLTNDQLLKEPSHAV